MGTKPTTSTCTYYTRIASYFCYNIFFYLKYLFVIIILRKQINYLVEESKHTQTIRMLESFGQTSVFFISMNDMHF